MQEATASIRHLLSHCELQLLLFTGNSSYSCNCSHALISPQPIETGMGWLLAAARAVSVSFQFDSCIHLQLHCAPLLLSVMASSSLFVVSIDFGTSYSGYCFSLASGTDQIRQVFWGMEHGYKTPKTPTCILFDQNQEFKKFGYDAVMKYKNLPPNEAHQWYFFQNFKMSLYNTVCRAVPACGN